MKRKRFSVEQIVAVLKQAELGMPVADVIRQMEISEQTNASLRDECVNLHWFETLDEARVIIEAWRIDYNESRPHMALNGVPPGEYARRHKDLEFHSTGRTVQN